MDYNEWIVTILYFYSNGYKKAYFNLTDPIFIRHTILMMYFQHCDYAFHVTTNRHNLPHIARNTVALRFILYCVLQIHIFLAGNNETRERNLEGEKIHERMIVGCKLVVLHSYVVLFGERIFL